MLLIICLVFIKMGDDFLQRVLLKLIILRSATRATSEEN